MLNKEDSIFVGKLNLQYTIMEILRSPLYINANMSVAKSLKESVRYVLNIGYSPKAFNEN